MNKLTDKEIAFLHQISNLIDEYLTSTRGKTTPHLSDFSMVLQSHVDANEHEKDYERV